MIRCGNEWTTNWLSDPYIKAVVGYDGGTLHRSYSIGRCLSNQHISVRRRVITKDGSCIFCTHCTVVWNEHDFLDLCREAIERD